MKDERADKYSLSNCSQENMYLGRASVVEEHRNCLLVDIIYFTNKSTSKKLWGSNNTGSKGIESLKNNHMTIF